MKKADAILVLGRGIYQDGSIPDSAKATIREAVDLYKTGVASVVVFSGKWSYSINYTPPMTEAEAMAGYALSIGLPEKAITVENESFTTVSNCYFIKTRTLVPNSWKRVILVSVYPMAERAFYNLKKVLGPSYHCELVVAHFSFPKDKLEEKEKIERQKMKDATRFYQGVKEGDHETIFRRSNKDLLKTNL